MSEITVVFDDYTADATDHDTQERSEFDVNADYLAAYIKSLAPKLQAFGPEANRLKDAVNVKAAQVITDGSYHGLWSSLTGANSIAQGDTVAHNNRLWVSTVAIADATTSEPDINNTDWVGFSVAPNAENEWTANQKFHSITEEIYTITGTTPAIDANYGAMQVWNLSGHSMPTLSTSFEDGQSVFLMINPVSSYTVDWAFVDQFAHSLAPVLENGKYTAVAVWKINATVYAARIGVFGAV